MRRIMRSREWSFAQFYRDPIILYIRDTLLIYLNIPSSKLIPILSWSDGVHKINEILLEQIRTNDTNYSNYSDYLDNIFFALTTFRRMQKKNANNAQIIFREYVPLLLLILVHSIFHLIAFMRTL